MLAFSAIVPHSPLLISEIGKENSRFVKKSMASLERVGQELYSSRPDVIIVIAAHGSVLADAFTLNLAQTFTISFAEFGDLSTRVELTGDVGLTHHYKENLETKVPVVLAHEGTLNYGAGVPLYYLTRNIDRKKVKVIPIYHSLLPFEAHYQFGMKLQEDILNDTKRIAVIASGELSSRLKQDAPAGYSAWAKKFDETVIKKIRNKDFQALLRLEKEFVEEVQECGLRCFSILFGIMNSINVKPEILSYEAPFGTGYLTAILHLP